MAETEREIIKKKLTALVEPQPVIWLTRENARAQVIEDVLSAWKLSGTTEKLNLIVLDADEKTESSGVKFWKFFPKAWSICRTN